MSPRPSSAAPLTVVKIGGSLLGDRARLLSALAALAAGAEGAVVVVPGGGPFAEAVRESQGRLGFCDSLAHRLALDAMGRVAEILCALEPALSRSADPAEATALARAGRVPVWDPAALKAGHPDIPESWDVTSDSLALWLAERIGAGRCLLLKSADAPAPAGADAAELARIGLVDAAFPAFAARFAGEIAIRGPRRVAWLPGAGRRDAA